MPNENPKSNIYPTLLRIVGTVPRAKLATALMSDSKISAKEAISAIRQYEASCRARTNREAAARRVAAMKEESRAVIICRPMPIRIDDKGNSR